MTAAKAVVEPCLGRIEIDRSTADEFQQHVVQPEVRPPLRSGTLLGVGVVGALVDDREAHVLEPGTRSDSGSGRPWLHSLSRAALAVAAGAALEVDAERCIG